MDMGKMMNREAVTTEPNEMETEPARALGDMFAKRALIQPIIGAAVALVAQVANLTVDTAVVDNLTILVTFGAVVYMAWSAQREKSELVTEQAEATRDAVYAPATVQTIATKAARTGDDTLPPPPAKVVAA